MKIWDNKATRVLIPTYYSNVSSQAWQDLFKLDNTIGSSIHWSVPMLQALHEARSNSCTETTRRQALPSTNSTYIDIRIFQWANYLSMKVTVFQKYTITADLSYDQKCWHFKWPHMHHPDFQLCIPVGYIDVGIIRQHRLWVNDYQNWHMLIP